MNFSELLDTLQKLKSGYKINQMSIANILGLSRQTMSKRFQMGTEVTVSELQEIENFYNVSLYKNQTNTFDRQNDETVYEKSSQFGKRLFEIQSKHNFLDREMATLLKISEKDYMKLKLGKIEPTFDVLLELKRNFKVNIDWLVFGE